MRLIFLSGMDGTGKLFASLSPFLEDYDVSVLSLPQTGRQDYNTLARQLKKELPEEDFMLIAESFSGPIAALLSQEGLENLKGIIFVATFLSPPKLTLLRLSKSIPLKAFMAAPFRRLFYKWLCFGFDAKDHILKSFEAAVRDVPETILKARLNAISAMELSLKEVSYPTLYLKAKQDRLVPQSKAREFKKYFKNIEVKTIKGPHFLLQSRPEKCASEIKGFIS